MKYRVSIEKYKDVEQQLEKIEEKEKEKENNN